MSGGRGEGGNREVSPLRKWPRRQGRHGLFSDAASDIEAFPKEGGSWGKHGFPHGSEPKASDAHETQTTSSAVMTALIVATGSRIFQPKRISWS